MSILDLFCHHVQTEDNNYRNQVWLWDHMAGGHALLWSCEAEISIILLLFMHSLSMVLCLGQAALATYEGHVLAEL
jgi:hypothetical protein